jgi:hypothetical protein
MFETNTIAPSQQLGFGMPVCGRVRPDAFGTSVDATRVSGYRHITAAAVLKGVFPGTSAWSPPI